MAESSSCIFCQIARASSTTTLLHSDERVVAFQDINPSAFRHYLVIPVEHIPTVKDLSKRTEDFSLVSHMLMVGQTLLSRDAPHAKHRFGFHQPPFNSVNHLHLHSLALPFIPRWKCLKYSSLGPVGGFIEAQKLLERIKPPSHLPSVSLNCFDSKAFLLTSDVDPDKLRALNHQCRKSKKVCVPASKVPVPNHKAEWISDVSPLLGNPPSPSGDVEVVAVNPTQPP